MLENKPEDELDEDDLVSQIWSMMMILLVVVEELCTMNISDKVVEGDCDRK